MTETQASKLKVGDRVRHADGVEGTVVEVSYAASRINWDDGEACLLTKKGADPDFLLSIVKVEKKVSR